MSALTVIKAIFQQREKTKIKQPETKVGKVYVRWERDQIYYKTV